MAILLSPPPTNVEAKRLQKQEALEYTLESRDRSLDEVTLEYRVPCSVTKPLRASLQEL